MFYFYMYINILYEGIVGFEYLLYKNEYKIYFFIFIMMYWYLNNLLYLI